jgi:hypothetical protein
MTSRRSLTALWVAVLCAGCSGAHEYTCPDPVGKIIQDDCEVYKTKYESLKVELGASLMGIVGAKTSIGQTSMRDPSDLLQVLSHRTLALCKDFNACRVPPLEYRQRREQTDRVFTAVSTIQEQLKQGTLDAESKGKLVQKLVSVLSEDQSTGSTISSTGTVSSGGGGLRRPDREQRRGPYHSWVPWFGTSLLPPQPRPVAGFPMLAHASYSLEHVFRQESPYGTIGYRPSANLFLLGPVEADDLVTVDWGGRTSDCPIGHAQENGLARLHCTPPKTLVLKGDSFTIKATYRRGGDGKAALIGQRTVGVLSREVEDTRNGSRNFALDHDVQAREGRLIFRPYHDGLPADVERPSLFVVLKLRKYHESTARCWVNEKLATEGLKTSRYTGQEGTFQDRPRYRTVKPGHSESVAEPFIEWWHQDFPLPFAVVRGGASVPDKLKPWPLKGSWRCVVSVEGEPVRELSFKIGPDGRPAAHPRQTERPEAAWLVETKVLSNPFEVPLR